MKDRIERIEKQIREAAEKAGRNPDEIRLVAVSKIKPAEMVREARDAGQTIFGENYIQEAVAKIEEVGDDSIEWHFIGHLQSKKSKYAAGVFTLIHSVDSLKLAKEINKQAAKKEVVQPILIQVNTSGEESKSGTTAEEVIELVREVASLENVAIKGLMTMPAFFDDPEGARPYFRQLRLIKDRIEALGIPGVEMKELSMGMSGDFEVAIEEGATLVRVGTAIFGARDYSAK
ncbi:YggS family pyridoxal phosphate-dependent enzyme [Desulfoluna butyratoxydans]|uniref:Pyridoxal phosphate homeostasis protein n=1 Tax=Desulfoluna butyratoxydans TaxID=231438 RepID=A0A4V6IM28_9BACT|nr:YggS family pyridoxal phosphate-dependent enzyme [Desulfoluna butyratoxydans]VFQ47368.1 pyridoxal phosphate homeostasis protein [Desulfoluna butyratoxydans]